MINKFLDKIKKMSKNNRIVVSLWLASFIMLIVFVIVAATVPQGVIGNELKHTVTDNTARAYANAVSIIGAFFAVFLSVSLIITVVFAYLDRKRGIKDDKNK